MNGIATEIITTTDDCDGATSMTHNQRNKVYRKFKNNDIQVLVSINALCEGFDEIQAKYAMLLRKIGGKDAKNPALFTQIVGRVIRSAPKKNGAVVIDFYDNVSRYGKVEDWNWDIKNQGVDRQCCMVKDGGKVLLTTLINHQRAYVVCGCSHVYDMKVDKCSQCAATPVINFCASKAELYGVDVWWKAYTKAARSTGLREKFNSDCNETLSEMEFGECMSDIEGLGNATRKSVYMGIKGTWYIPVTKKLTSFNL